MPRIRPIAICLLRHEGKILVFEGWDRAERRAFYRPLGGGIEFGETGQHAVQRFFTNISRRIAKRPGLACFSWL